MEFRRYVLNNRDLSRNVIILYKAQIIIEIDIKQ